MCWSSRWSRTRSSTASPSRATSGSTPPSSRPRSSCGRASSTRARGCRTRSTGSSSCTAATAATPPRSSPRSSSSTRTASTSCSRSTRARPPASAASPSSATSEFSDSTLRGVVQTQESAWYRFLSTDDTYDPDRVSFDEELLRRFYNARGYADFQVVSAVAELTPGRQGLLHHLHPGGGSAVQVRRDQGRDHARGSRRPSSSWRWPKASEGDVYNAELGRSDRSRR